jgi:hypothetical protein
MESAIAKAIQLKYHQVTLMWSNDKSADAMQFSEGKWDLRPKSNIQRILPMV